MPPRIVKYNPAFLTDEELIRAFVVHQSDLELLLQIVRENTDPANQHVLLLGPRGIGKTTLALRVAAEIRRAADLRDRWYPIVFGEESYDVSSVGRFWLEALLHLGEQTRDERWKRAYLELRTEREDAMRQRALGQLLDFADARRSRILLIVENLHMLLGDQIRDKDAWLLREVLLNEPRIMILGSATNRFREITHYSKALYEVFRVQEVKPLDTRECADLWRGVTGREIDVQHVRPLEILTGGNPRLLTIVASVAKSFSLRNLVDDLEELVDDHTDYLKSFLDGLAPTERRVYLTLAEIWDPATANAVAAQSGLGVNTASSLLKRLVERGAVLGLETDKRKHEYQIAERLYNIYYLMRRHGGASNRVLAVVKFMSNFYAPDELIEKTRRIAEEACGLQPNERQDHFCAYRDIFKLLPSTEFRLGLLKTTPPQFFEADDAPAELKEIYVSGVLNFADNPIVKNLAIEIPTTEDVATSPPTATADGRWLELFHQAKSLFTQPGPRDEAQRLLNYAIAAAPNTPTAQTRLGVLLREELNRYDAAESAYRKAIELKPDYARAWARLGQLLHEDLKDFPEAEKTYRKAIELKPDVAWAWAQLGQLLHEDLKNYPEAEKSYRRAIELEPDDARAWAQLGQLLHENLKNYPEAEKSYRKVIELKPDYAWAWAQLGQLLHEDLKNYTEAEKSYRKAIELNPDYAWAWALLGRVLHEPLKNYPESERCYRKAVGLEPEVAWGWAELGQLLHEDLKNYPEAEKAYLKAIQLEPAAPSAYGRLFDLMWAQPERRSEALDFVDNTLRAHPDNAGVLNGLAWHIYRLQIKDLLPRAEQAAARAVELAPTSGIYLHTLASILSAQGKAGQALESARKYLDDLPSVQANLPDAIDLFVDLAAAGQGRDAARILDESPSRGLLEPLVAGIRLFLGEEVKVAAEILEVGKDVAKRIEERQRQRQNGTAKA